MMEVEKRYSKLNEQQKRQVLAGLIGVPQSREFDSIVRGLKNKYKVQNLPKKKGIKEEVKTLNSLQGSLDKKDGYKCDICKNKGYVSYEKDGYIYTKECKCMKIRRTIANMQKSGLEELIKTCTFDNFETTEYWQQIIKDMAQKYVKTVDKPKEWLFIGGSSGSGKTHICTAICREFLLKGLSVKYMLWREETPKLKAMLNDGGYSKKMEKIKNVEVLYIDDLLKTANGEVFEMPTASDIRIAFEIIDYRKNRGLKTLISNERYIMEIVDLDEALGTRIVEMCGKYLLNIQRDRNKNYRLKKIGEITICR